MPPYPEPAWSHDFHAGFFSKQTLLHDLNLQRNRHRRGERAFVIASFKAVHRTKIESRCTGGNGEYLIESRSPRRHGPQIGNL